MNKINFENETSFYRKDVFVFRLDTNSKDFSKLLNHIRSLPNRSYKATDEINKLPDPRWIVPINDGNLEQIVPLMEQYHFGVDKSVDDVIAVYIDKQKHRIEMFNHSKAEDIESELNIPSIKCELRPFQKAGVLYATKSKRTFIADEMGLGKTVQAIAVAEYNQAFPVLVICPASLKFNWFNEILKWTGQQSMILNGGKVKYNDPNSKYVITNYDILEKHDEYLKSRIWNCIVVDESHYVKNYKTKRTRAVKEITKDVPFVLLLTGTPVLNRPNEIISQLEILKRLDDFGGFWNFVRKYCNARREQFGWNFSGSAHLDELNEKMRQRCYIRRQKKNVLKELPDKQRIHIPVEISNLTEYKRAQNSFIDWLENFVANDQKFLDSIKDMDEDVRKSAIRAHVTDKSHRAQRAEQIVQLEYLKQLSAVGKMNAVIEWISDFLETGEKLVIFATHRNIHEQLHQEFKDISVTITGDDSSVNRQKSVDKFQTDENTRLIICSLKAGGVGITLTESSNVVFVEYGWTPADHDQAEDRLHRIGQKDSVMCYYFTGLGTVDEDIYELIEQKRQIVDNVTEGGQAVELKMMNELISRLLNIRKKQPIRNNPNYEQFEMLNGDLPF